MFSNILDLPTWLIPTAQVLLGLAAAITCYRIWRGPSVMDRIVALDLFASITMAQFVLLVFSSGFTSYLDVASAIAIISFIATIAFARYLEKTECSL